MIKSRLCSLRLFSHEADEANETLCRLPEHMKSTGPSMKPALGHLWVRFILVFFEELRRSTRPMHQDPGVDHWYLSPSILMVDSQGQQVNSAHPCPKGEVRPLLHFEGYTSGAGGAGGRKSQTFNNYSWLSFILTLSLLVRCPGSCVLFALFVFACFLFFSCSFLIS